MFQHLYRLKKRKEQAFLPAPSAVDVGVKEKDMVIGRTHINWH